jgi:putative FmdB family regulatory protein
MPIYEFVCKECDTQFEEMRLSSSAFTDISCPKCGTAKVEKTLSTFAPAVSGGGGSSSLPCEGGSAGSGPCSSGMCGFN